MAQASTSCNKPRTERERVAYNQGLEDGRDSRSLLIVLATLGFFGMIAVSSIVESIFAPTCQVEASE